MKKSVVLCLFSLLFAQSAMAAVTCLFEAELQARIFSAKKNRLNLSNIQVVEFSYLSETQQSLSYAVQLNTQEILGLTLSLKDCSLISVFEL